MNDADAALEAIRAAAEELVPELAERLKRHGLGELEVRSGTLRLRVSGTPTPAEPVPATGGLVPAAAGHGDGIASSGDPASPGGTAPQPDPAVGVSSPAVGFFVYADGLGPGLEVAKGDSLGHVEMLGVRHDVRAPRTGTVRNLVAESGEAVEYGQVVVELESAEAGK